MSGIVDLMADGRVKHDGVEQGSVAWWGHATVAVALNRTTVLTDPVLTNRVGHLVRRRGERPPASVLAPDAVLLSHLHADHTHLPSLRLLARSVPIVLPLGAPRRLPALRRLGCPLIELTVGDSVEIGNLRVSAVPAEHDGRRWRHGARDVEALGYTIEGSTLVYFAGDTALFDAMSEWVPTCELALLPVGGWGPSLGSGHMDPRSAATAASAVQARMSIPIHYGTFWPAGLARVRPHLFRDPGETFAAEAALLGRSTVVLDQGGTWPLPR